jgi:hypothetical protein
MVVTNQKLYYVESKNWVVLVQKCSLLGKGHNNELEKN